MTDLIEEHKALGFQACKTAYAKDLQLFCPNPKDWAVNFFPTIIQGKSKQPHFYSLLYSEKSPVMKKHFKSTDVVELSKSIEKELKHFIYEERLAPSTAKNFFIFLHLFGEYGHRIFYQDRVNTKDVTFLEKCSEKIKEPALKKMVDVCIDEKLRSEAG